MAPVSSWIGGFSFAFFYDGELKLLLDNLVDAQHIGAGINQRSDMHAPNGIFVHEIPAFQT